MNTMKLKLLVVIFTIFISNTLIGQSLNEYKYVIIPSKYEFLKTENQYQLNSLTKYLFEKEGFKTTYNNVELPAEISENGCLALTANVINSSNMFTTKLLIELINCKNQKVLTGEVGKSKEKDYKKGFQEALRKAFQSVSALNYTATNEPAVVKEQIKKVAPEEIEIIESSENQVADDIGIPEIEDEIEIESVEVEAPETPVVEMERIEKVVEKDIEVEEIADVTEVNTTVKGNQYLLYAQANPLGYQLVDSSPKVVYILLNSSKKNVYLLRDKNGMVYKEAESWFVEYYKNDELIKKPLKIKF